MQKLIWQNSEGEEINLTSGNYGITEWEGFSNADLNIQSQQVPFQDGGVFLDALLEQRELSVTLAMNDEGNLETRYRLRRELIHALNPKLGEGYLIYTNDFISKRIKCVAQVPLFETHNSNDSGTPKASLAWTACNPYWEDVEETDLLISNKEQFSIVNEGDIPVNPKVRFITKNVTEPTIYNVTTEQKITYKGVLNDNLEIDTEVGKKQVNTLKFDITISQNIGDFLNSVIYAEEKNMFYAVGSSGIIINSIDGVNWTYVNNGVIDGIYQLNKIMYCKEKNIFLAVGNYGVILKSNDGVNFHSVSNPTTNSLKAVTYSANLDLFIIVGDNGVILKSSNGDLWEAVTTSISVYWRAVTYSEEEELFIATGSNIYSSPDGNTWTQKTTLSNEYVNDVKYFKNNFFAITTKGRVLKSSDGNTWNEVYNDGNSDFSEIVYSDFLDLILIIKRESSSYKISTDGETFTSASIDVSSPRPLSITYSEKQGIFLIVGYKQIISSTNGYEWNLYNKTSGDQILSMAYSEKLKLYVAVGSYGYILISKNKKEWIEVLSGSSRDYFNSIIYVKKLNLFIIVGSYGKILISPDGVNWQDVSVATNNYLYSIAYSEEKNILVAVGANGTIIYSRNAISWSFVTEDFGNYELNNILYNEEKGKFYCTRNFGSNSIAESEDGINWSLINTSFTSRIYERLIYVKEYELYLLSNSSILYKTKDFITGEQITLPEGINSIYAIAYNEKTKTFYLGDSRGLLLTSSDLVNWEKEVNIGIQIDCFLVDKETVFIGCDNATIFYFGFIKNENKIQNLSENSDMNFRLLNGSNFIRITKKTGNMNVQITYRQKYIGV